MTLRYLGWLSSDDIDEGISRKLTKGLFGQKNSSNDPYLFPAQEG
jgi:hypothetical protein